YSIVALTNSSGSITERYAYDAYGDLTITDASGTVRTTSSDDNRYTYTGREWDETIELYHYRARMYDPKAGRFIGRDPIGYEGSPWNLFEFLGGNPLMRVDPGGKGFLNEGGNAICNCPCSVVDVLSIGNATVHARNVSEARFPDGVQGGRGDAFRHCMWNCSMRTSVDEDCMRCVTDFHELDNIRNGGPMVHVGMDRTNNEIGLRLGRGCWLFACCADACQEALDNGELTVIVDAD
uniref:RHS repeat domain-containing protein n=1 Tax=Rhodopirellula europaea TaxID=1263866 RepID=UPI003D2702F5